MAPITLSGYVVISLVLLADSATQAGPSAEKFPPVSTESCGGAECTTFTFTNNCPYTVYPATLTGGGGQQLSSTGFELASKATFSLTASAPWSGRFWGRTGCSTDSSGKFTCATADCASGRVSCDGAGAIPPATLAEFTLQTDGKQDFYDISLVDGFNVPVSVAPRGGSGACASSSCPSNVNSGCLSELASKGSDGTTVGCKSACLAFNTPQYCCTGAFSKPETCPPTKYSKYFKGKCPQAYSYAYDDKSSTFTCSNPSSYQITFCP